MLPKSESLPVSLATALGPKFAARAASLGLAVTRPDGGRTPIPPVFNPVVVAEGWLEEESRRAARLLGLVRRAAVHDLSGAERTAVLDSLAPGLERDAVSALGVPEALATVRADLFLGDSGPRVLEVNTTIPAMQGYGDMAARAFIEVLGAHRGLSKAEIETLISENGENTLALLRALKAFQAQRGDPPLRSIALVHRPLDSQLSELQYLAERWRAEGVETAVATADQVHRGPGIVEVAGKQVDLIYRHIFARRVEASWDLAAMLEQGGFPITNAVSAPLELKSSLATLSEAGAEGQLAGELGLDDGDRELVAARVPWTRRLRPGPAVDSSGKPLPDLMVEVGANPARYVLKRSWDYGGKAVFLGFEHDQPSTAERMVQAFGERLEWPALVQRCAEDRRGGGFVVQERVVTQAQEMLICAEAGVRPATLFTDLSVFASLGLPEVGWGGVVRASQSAVVNIASGGGVAPLLRESVAKKLLAGID